MHPLTRSYPQDLLDLFETKYRAAKPTKLLDYNGVELLLVAEREDASHAIGEKEAKADEAEARKLKRHAVYDEVCRACVRLR